MTQSRDPNQDGKDGRVSIRKPLAGQAGEPIITPPPPRGPQKPAEAAPAPIAEPAKPLEAAAQAAIDEAARSLVARRRCDAADMQGLLQRISDQIADTDRRHGELLADMQSRLGELAQRTQEARASASKESAAGIGQIEGRIGELARQLESASRSWQDAAKSAERAKAATDSAARTKQLEPAARTSSPVPVVRSAEPRPAEAKPAAASPGEMAAPSYPRTTVRPGQRPEQKPAATARPAAPAAAKPAPAPEPRDANDPWDAEQADALARIYSEIAAQSPAAPADPKAGAVPVSEPPALKRSETAASSEAVRAAYAHEPHSAPADVFKSKREPAPALAATTAAGVDKSWLEDRFAEIASGLERSLEKARPDGAISALGERFAALETRIEQAIGQVRKGGGGSDDAVRSVERQVAGLRTQLDKVNERMGSLEALRVEIEQIGKRMGAVEKLDKDLPRLIEQVAAARSDMGEKLGALAGLGAGLPKLAQELASTRGDVAELTRLVLEKGVAAHPAAGQSPEQMEALAGMFEAYAAERRDGEGAVVAVLQEIQGAIDRLSERVQAVEEIAAAASLPAQSEPAGFGQRQAQQPSHEAIAEPVAAEPPPGEEPPAAPQRARRMGLLRGGARPGPAAEVEPRAERHQEVEPEPRLEAQRTPAAEPELALADGGRQDVIGQARRAAMQAAMQAQARAQTAELREKARPKKRGLRSFERGSTKPVYVVLLIATLAFGAGTLWKLVAEPGPVQGTIGSQKPRASLEQRGDARGTGSDLALTTGEVVEPSAARQQREAGASDPASVALPATVAAADQSMPMHTASARTQPPSAAAPSVPARRADHTAITAGIVLDQGGATPSVQELRRATHEQRMAQMSNDVGSRAVQSSQREVAAAAKPAPASLTPDATRPEAQVSDAPAAAARRDLSGGMPPAQIGPNSLRLAAAKGDPSAEFEVASRYAQGKGVAKDFAKAAEWYGRAASKGFAPAQYRLGGLHERGIGVPADLARARAWYRRAAELGNVKAMHNLAVMHTQRNGAAEPEYTTAAHWFAEAAERGLADSQFNLAILYDNGMGVAKSPAEAWKWFALAAGQGDGEAGKRREAIGQRMQPAELAALRNTVAGWRPKAVDQVANDPFAAGQAWRNRNGEPSASASTPAVRRAPAEAEIIDLTEEAMQPKAQPTAAAGGGAGGDKQRRSVQTKDQVDVERLLTQHGYDPSKLKGKPAAGAPATD